MNLSSLSFLPSFQVGAASKGKRSVFTAYDEGGKLSTKEKTELKALLRLPTAATMEQVSAMVAACNLVRARESAAGTTFKLSPSATVKSWFMVAAKSKPSSNYFVKPVSKVL